MPSATNNLMRQGLPPHIAAQGQEGLLKSKGTTVSINCHFNTVKTKAEIFEKISALFFALPQLIFSVKRCVQTIAWLLIVSILFSSLAPSYAQAQEAVRIDRGRVSGVVRVVEEGVVNTQRDGHMAAAYNAQGGSVNLRPAWVDEGEGEGIVMGVGSLDERVKAVKDLADKLSKEADGSGEIREESEGQGKARYIAYYKELAEGEWYAESVALAREEARGALRGSYEELSSEAGLRAAYEEAVEAYAREEGLSNRLKANLLKDKQAYEDFSREQLVAVQDWYSKGERSLEDGTWEALYKEEYNKQVIGEGGS